MAQVHKYGLKNISLFNYRLERIRLENTQSNKTNFLFIIIFKIHTTYLSRVVNSLELKREL